jgi:hypothetical protein
MKVKTVSVRDIVAEAGMGRTSEQQNSWINKFERLGILNIEDFRTYQEDVEILRDMGIQKYERIRLALRGHGVEIQPHRLIRKSARHKPEFVAEKIAYYKAQLAIWTEYAKAKGFEI